MTSIIDVFGVTMIARLIREANACLVVLLQKIGVFTFSPISSSRNRSHNASCVAVAAAIYSASIVLKATVGCDLDCQLIGPPASKNAYPEID